MTVENWSKSIAFDPHDVRDAASEETIVDEVRAARDAGRVLRPMGSGHSSTEVFVTDDILLTQNAMSGVTNHDAEAGTATLMPGTTLEDAGAALAEHGLAMENLGDVNYQTIAGAIGTGTHGTGIEMGNLSTTLVGGRLVSGTGDIVPFGTEAGRSAHDEPDDLLRAVRVSLGALGVLSSMTLAVRPSYDLHRRNWMTHIDWTMEHFDELVAENRHFDFYWYPRSDRAQVRTMNEPGHEPQVIPPEGDLKTDETGPSYDIITNDRDLRFDEMEYMLPLEDGMAAFQRVRERIKERHRADVGWRVLVRTVAADDTMISNCAGRPTMTIALLHNNELDHDEYFSDMEPVLQDLGGRPHWGKKHGMRGERLRELYPEFDTFRSIRRDLDPDGVLLNDYLRALLGEEDDR